MTPVDKDAEMRTERSLPVEQIRALVRLLYPEHMTPIAKRQFDAVCDGADHA